MEVVMRYKLLISFTLLFLLIENIGIAQQVTQTEAINAAINTLRYETRNNITVDSIDNIYRKIVGNNILLYEVAFKNGYIVLLSGHKSCTPVLSVMSDNHNNNIINNTTDMPEALIDLIGAYIKQIQFCFDRGLEPMKQSEWNRLQYYDTLYSNNVNVLRKTGPIIDTKWGQDVSNDYYSWAYNYYVTDSTQNCGRCPAGCVSVAMAQIIRKWEWPTNIPYSCSDYDWSNMPDELIKRDNDNYINERNAIAKLIYDCAESLGTIYCNNGCGSSASTSLVPITLKKFGYANAVYKEKDSYTTEEWNNLLMDDLDNDRPIQYRGSDSSNNEAPGHSFICDGYKKRFLAKGYKYHFNWGWNGLDDGWFVIDDITSDPENDMIDYHYKQAAVFNIYPTNCWDNIIMECDKYFNAGENKNYCINNNFGNNHNSYIINSGANVQIRAGNKIILSDGFHAKEGSHFLAEITSSNSSRGNNDDKSHEVAIDKNVLYEYKEVSTTSVLHESLHGITIYPNPTNDMFNVSFNNPEECMKQITVVNHQGCIVINKDNPNDNVINMNNLSSGLYIVKIISNKGNVYFDKVIKN